MTPQSDSACSCFVRSCSILNLFDMLYCLKEKNIFSIGDQFLILEYDCRFEYCNTCFWSSGTVVSTIWAFFLLVACVSNLCSLLEDVDDVWFFLFLRCLDRQRAFILFDLPSGGEYAFLEIFVFQLFIILYFEDIERFFSFWNWILLFHSFLDTSYFSQAFQALASENADSSKF